MFLAIVFILFILSSRFLLLNICIFGFLSPYKGVRMCICVFEGGRGVVSKGCWRQRSKGVRGGGWGGSDTPEREAISQLVCSLGSQAENAADLWSKLKWCQCGNKAPS